jgi:hypothetical protein
MTGPPRVLSIPVYAYKLGHVVGHQLTSRTKIKNITKSGSPNRINNLIKALSIYESEFYAGDEKELNKVSKFRSFSIVTELAINWDTEVTNRDAEFKNLTDIPIRKAQNLKDVLSLKA